MHVGMLTREYPPEIYGGAGVHVTELTRHLRAECDVTVHCMGAERDPGVAIVHSPDPTLTDANPSLSMLSTQLHMAHALSPTGESSGTPVDVVHSHTWYTGFAGHVTSLLNSIPHVVTAHSLEPHRPWKVEQLGGGYHLSSWSERTAMTQAAAVIAVSKKMRGDVLEAYPELDPAKVHVILNGIDPTLWHPMPTFEAAEASDSTGHTSVLRSRGVDPTRPIVAFVGRITRQKGVAHLLRAAHDFPPEAQLVLCAGAPDTPEIARETEAAVRELQEARDGVFWIQQMLDRPHLCEIHTAADVFVCPSIYEPLGIVNLEAMACGTAVVASDVGGIPEVVVDGETGRLVHYDESDPRGFERRLAETVAEVIVSPERSTSLGQAGLRRAVDEFSWASIARQTAELYRSLC